MTPVSGVEGGVQVSLSSKVGLVAAGAAAAGVLVVGGSALADAATGSSPSGTSSPGAEGYGAPGYGGGGGGARGGSPDTPVTGDELAKVKAAVTAKDSTVTVTSVQKDPDGSYDVFGTKSGTQVMFEVSKDLKTITQGAAGRGGRGGGSADTPVTGTEAAQVTAAVKAKDSAVSVTSVRKDPDGSYDVLGTKSGTQVMYEVSKDLKTITQNTFAGQGRPGGRGHGAPGSNPESGSSSQTAPSSTT
jgi:hypothetical protein